MGKATYTKEAEELISHVTSKFLSETRRISEMYADDRTEEGEQSLVTSGDVKTVLSQLLFDYGRNGRWK